MSSAFLNHLRSDFLLFDGAMGTMLQAAGLSTGRLPEALNIEEPAAITAIQRQYVEAGSHAILTNTFGANALKLKDSGYTVEEVVHAAVACARAAGPQYVVLDIGPIGQLMAPMGTLSFEEAYELAAEQVRAGAAAGADAIFIETLSDLYEARAAVLAAKEHSDLPVICTMTFEADGRTFVGCDPITATLTLQGLGVDALGVNCSLGPKELLPVVEQMLAYAKVPVVVEPNAGLPREVDGQTVFDITPEEYAAHVSVMLDRGVHVIGGCCGTNPTFIRQLAALFEGRTPVKTNRRTVTAACSGTSTHLLDGRTTVIGERINPTGRKKLQQALRERRMDVLLTEAIDQTEAGADILDVNVGLPELDEPETMRAVMREILGVCALPLQIDSSDPTAIEAGVRLCNGRPIINSVNGKPEVLEQILPIAKKYGALVVGLALDESGIPPTAEQRLCVAERILAAAEQIGLPREDLLIDCLVLTASAQQEQVLETLKAIMLVKSRLGLKTVLGVSNVSFGLPGRARLNSTFLAAALGAGLDAAILNPLSKDMMQVVDTFRVLSNEDVDATRYIEKYGTDKPADRPAAEPSERSLYDCIVQGRRDEAAAKARELLQTRPALELIDGEFVPALNAVGERFEKGELFLPQLMQSAAAVKSAFEVVRAATAGEAQASKGKILLSTVEGDIHDIGKNIVRMMLENYGYDVMDLGRDVSAERVVETVLEHSIKLVGLSALMTTTVRNMKATIEALHKAGADCKVMVGGAVLTSEYAELVGADFYAADAQEGVRIAAQVFGGW